jgi:hypothetical protein
MVHGIPLGCCRQSKHRKKPVSRQRKQPKRKPPIQFRAESDLGQPVRDFAAEHGLPLNEACKVLVALAVNELDRRHYRLVRQLADAMAGRNAVPRACYHIYTALQGARRVTDSPLQLDPERAYFIIWTVHDYLVGKGLPVEGLDISFLPVAGEAQESQPAESTGTSMPTKFRRKIHANVVEEIARVARERQKKGHGEDADVQAEGSEETRGAQGGEQARPDPAR